MPTLYEIGILILAAAAWLGPIILVGTILKIVGTAILRRITE